MDGAYDPPRSGPETVQDLLGVDRAAHALAIAEAEPVARPAGLDVLAARDAREVAAVAGQIDPTATLTTQEQLVILVRHLAALDEDLVPPALAHLLE